jgi:hypothetical protein
MKKLLATILAFVYLSTSMGATIHLHYCMGKLASWGLINHESNTCAQCGMVVKKTPFQNIESKKSCCKDEHKQIKTGVDQKFSPSEVYKLGDFSQDIAIKEAATQNINVFSFPVAYPKTHAPPLISKPPLFIIHRNFRL